MADFQFKVWDYVVCGCLLLVSAGIGVYHAFTGGRQSTTKEFLLADKKMRILPVTMSMLASFMSAITLMGNPAEIYNYGTQFLMIGSSYLLVMPIAAHFYIPIFCNLNLTSIYEYLELRFSKGVRFAASCTFMLQMLFYLAIVLYAPALALNQVTGLSVWISVLSVGVVCTFYTALGGMRAVVYTDLLQICIMFIGMITILVKGSMDVDGFQNVLTIAREGDRLELFQFDPDPRVRHSFWTLFFGATFTWLAIYAVNQAQVQRTLSVPNLKRAQIAVYANIPGLVGLLVITSGCGLVIYANFQGCDPLLSGKLKSPDQLVPLFVMMSLGQYPGLPGLFLSAIFSGSLSTLSSGFNSLAAITLQDIIKSFYKRDLTERQATVIAKMLAMGFGIFCIIMSYAAAFMGSILQAAIALFGILGGPILGLFTLGIFFPWANWKGAYVGLLGSLAMTMWIGFGAIFVDRPYNPKKPLSTEFCVLNSTNASSDLLYNSSISTSANESYLYNNTMDLPSMSNTNGTGEKSLVADLYAISYLYYSLIAVIVCLLLGITTSFLTGPQNPKELDPQLITPVLAKIFCCLPPTKKKLLWCGVRHDKNSALAINDDETQPMKNTDSTEEMKEIADHPTNDPVIRLEHGTYTAKTNVYLGETIHQVVKL